VHVFVHAPGELASRFDEFGVLRPALWEQAPIALNEASLQFVDRPADQAAAVVEFVRERAEAGAGAEDVIVGLANESLASPVRVALDEHGVASRWIGGSTAKQTSAAKLLSAIADRLESDRTPMTSELVRHPEIGRWLKRKGLPAGWLMKLDEAVINYAPRRLGVNHRQLDDRSLAVARSVVELIEQTMSPLAGTARPIGDWAAPVCGVLQEIYGDRKFGEGEEDRREAQALQKIRDVLQGLSGIPEALAPATTASAAIRLAVDGLSRELLTPDEQPDAVEMVGWLELPLDDSPAVVVCGMNDGFVPSSLNNDMFLPNGLREELGLEDNRRRYARDAYALSVVSHSRESVRFVSGRHDALGDPLIPSRLLFATDEQTIARRLIKAFEAASSIEAEGQEHRGSGFRVPRPKERCIVERLRVTAFRDYIACPYRFYLRHIENLRSVADLEGELTAANFGTLIHAALNRWAESDATDATDPAEVRKIVEQAFDEASSSTLDDDPLPAVKLQLEQARLRLKVFAEWQAEHRREGWRLRFHEVEVSRDLKLESGRTLTIRGQIDRIDYHADRNEWLIIDYKTGDSALGPEEVHLSSGEWVDLQLPLYRWLAATLDIPGEPGVAYLALGREPPKHPMEIFKPASWSADLWAQAYWKMFRIAEDVAAGIFWPPAKEPPRFDDFACVVQEGAFGREVLR
jgi:ATP-dependent helicase/nuclease subunit B